jgi:hypothetical protein
MSHRNTFLTAIALGTLLFAARAAANDAPNYFASTTNHSALAVSLRGGEKVGDHQVQRVFMDIGTNKLAFIVPTDFRMDASDTGRIVLSGNSSPCYITVRVSSPTSADAESQNAFFRAEALSRYPGAKVSEESSDSAAGHMGNAFNLEWTDASGTPECVRIAFIPCAAGVLEFSAQAPASYFHEAQMNLTVLMTSVRSNETGKLVIVPLPDFS